ncbi:GMC family oxidoreductase [Candidatus Kirkpatrickella diaphorinae]|uniref:GMC family oxidoreductase n=1 Tax=Candidatus Kirkpatrickella diaphorinae TaxID=2984322 RepID=A0ABY6GHU7_9PROT|nr:GMC family oxidoreductase [Candidatus Kirkpatrickella diaphorinae]UYH51078.1 GMC family oxidoreductase [Candidatus Kirkpatrickella diaphorinae]
MTQHYDADVIIVGSGASGSNAAFELARKGKSVIILESGVWIPRWKIVENFRSSPRKGNHNDPYPNQPWAPSSFSPGYIENTGSFEYLPGMLRLVGGTTWHWAAATWRYIPNDMKLKTLYGVGRDWPVSYDTLEPYYGRAEYNLGVCGSDSEDQSGQMGGLFPPRSTPYPIPPEAETYYFQRLKARLSPSGFNFLHEPNARTNQPWDGRPGCSGNNNCMPVCPIGAMYSGDVHARHTEKAGGKVITDATVFKIEKGEGNKIAAVHYRTSKHEEVRLTARAFILAANGLEIPKLMLMSDIGNSSDQVGRNLMDHTGIGLQFLADEPLWPGRGQVQQGGIFNWRDGAFRREHAAIKHALTNIVPNRAIAERLLSQGVVGPELDRQIRHMAARWVDFSTTFEMLPIPTNRIQPSTTRRDALGIPTMVVNYDTDDYIAKGAAVARSQFAEIVKIMNGTVIEDNTGWQNRDHIMGTTIMGDDPKDSVVNHECRSWDHDNLFLATTGVIPASGVVNPTLTAIAFAIRIADILEKEV